MATEFSYWFLTKAAMPAFKPPSTPKQFLKEHFSRHASNCTYGAGLFPAVSALTRAELVAAGLSAGYGKQQSWARIFAAPRSDRQMLYSYLRRRLEMTLSCLDVAGGKATPKRFWRGVEPSEKGAISFNLGSLGAAIAANRWMEGAGHDVRRFLHTRLFIDGGLVRKPLHFASRNESLPDYLVEDSAGGWHVFEAKGGDKGNRWKQLLDGLLQVVPVVAVGRMGHAMAPCSSVCVQTLVHENTELAFTLVDPPPPQQDGRDSEHPFQIEVLEDLADLVLCLEALDWFACLADIVQFRNTAENALLTLLGFRVWNSTAFGGMTIALPEAFFMVEAKARAILRVVTEFKALVEQEEQRSSSTRTDEQLVDRVRSSSQRLQQSDRVGGEEDPDTVRRGFATIVELVKQPLESDLYEWQSRLLRELMLRLGVGELAQQIAKGREDARARAVSTNATAVADSTTHGATSAGGLLIFASDEVR